MLIVERLTDDMERQPFSLAKVFTHPPQQVHHPISPAAAGLPATREGFADGGADRIGDRGLLKRCEFTGKRMRELVFNVHSHATRIPVYLFGIQG